MKDSVGRLCLFGYKGRGFELAPGIWDNAAIVLCSLFSSRVAGQRQL